jgi:phosphoenolpyruvate carboxylase
MLPAWLGAGEALAEVWSGEDGEVLHEMADNWPFFATRLSMLEMVYAKSDAGLSAYYDARLVPEDLKPIGERLRAQLARDIQTVLSVLESDTLVADQPWTAESIRLRNIYTDPLNFLQAELLQRNREHSEPELERAIMVTIAGIAAGMRNTG